MYVCMYKRFNVCMYVMCGYCMTMSKAAERKTLKYEAHKFDRLCICVCVCMCISIYIFQMLK